jgi:hypothetical protein
VFDTAGSLCSIFDEHLIGVPRVDPDDLHAPQGEIDQEHRVVGHEPPPGPDLRREEIGPADRAPVCEQKRCHPDHEVPDLLRNLLPIEIVFLTAISCSGFFIGEIIGSAIPIDARASAIMRWGHGGSRRVREAARERFGQHIGSRGGTEDHARTAPLVPAPLQRGTMSQ